MNSSEPNSFHPWNFYKIKAFEKLVFKLRTKKVPRNPTYPPQRRKDQHLSHEEVLLQETEAELFRKSKPVELTVCSAAS